MDIPNIVKHEESIVVVESVAGSEPHEQSRLVVDLNLEHDLHIHGNVVTQELLFLAVAHFSPVLHVPACLHIALLPYSGRRFVAVRVVFHSQGQLLRSVHKKTSSGRASESQSLTASLAEVAISTAR